jgi:hypothetical protein
VLSTCGLDRLSTLTDSRAHRIATNLASLNQNLVSQNLVSLSQNLVSLNLHNFTLSKSGQSALAQFQVSPFLALGARPPALTPEPPLDFRHELGWA